MRKYFVGSAVVAVGIALVVGTTALAKPHVVRAGSLFIRDNGGIVPNKLPRHTQTPISAWIDAEIGTSDGSHPPAVETLDVDFDKSIQVNAKGLPVCKEHQLVARSTVAAKKACPDAIVGSGSAAVEVAFPEQAPFGAKGPIVLFNGGVRGGTTLLFVHTYVSVPAPTAVVVRVELTRINRGRYGLHAFAEVPRVAGGAGSATGFEIEIDRKFTYKGKGRSYLTASCPTGTYYTEGDISFSDDTRLHFTHPLPCTPKG